MKKEVNAVAPRPERVQSQCQAARARDVRPFQNILNSRLAKSLLAASAFDLP